MFANFAPMIAGTVGDNVLRFTFDLSPILAPIGFVVLLFTAAIIGQVLFTLGASHAAANRASRKRFAVKRFAVAGHAPDASLPSVIVA